MKRDPSPKKTRKIPLEHDEQSAVIRFWEAYCKLPWVDLPECLLFAIPNGGERHVAVATRLKAEGVRKGIPDIFLAAPRKQYHGLFIEMKRVVSGRVSKEQALAMEALEMMGFKCVVCKGSEAAVKEIERYILGQFS